MRSNSKKKAPPPKSKNWAEQDDAFFGSKPSWLSSSSSSAAAAKPTTTSKQQTVKKSNHHHATPTRRKTIEQRKDSVDNQIRVAATKQKERISNIAKKAASKFSDFIENSNEVNKRRNDQGNISARNNDDYGAIAESAKSSNNHNVATSSRKGGTTSIRKYKKVHVPSSSDINAKSVARTVKNTLVSQVPMPCAYCRAIPIMYQVHPFHGPSERICSTHDFRTVPKCLSCHKFEPKNAPYQEIGTTGKLVCPACAKTAILDNGAAREIYNEILVFFQSYDLDLFHGAMMNVPINLVSTQEMNRNFSTFKAADSADKYGVCCWSELHSPLGAAVGLIGAAGAAAAKGVHKFVRNQNNKTGRLKEETSSSSNGGTKRNPLGAGRFVSITQIAALKGLPRIYLGQVLAHEATHAWIALNPIRKQGVAGENLQFGVARKLPLMVEEGCCQLVAHLYLDSLPSVNRSSDENLLVEFCCWNIENHSIYEYGEGYKQAARAYNNIIDAGGSLGDLLEYVSIHMSFPPC